VSVVAGRNVSATARHSKASGVAHGNQVESTRMLRIMNRVCPFDGVAQSMVIAQTAVPSERPSAD
jgi:hypothetical protein